MVAEGLLTAPQAEILHRMVEQAVRACGGDTDRTLRTLGGDRTLRSCFGPTFQRHLAGSVREPKETTPAQEPAEDVTMEHPGRYSLVAEPGQGENSQVHRAHDDHIGREVAFKELSAEAEGPEEGSHDAALLRFLREARITGMLEHPSVVPVYELGRRMDGRLYYTMKLVKGKTLAQEIRERPTLPRRLMLLARLEDVCQAVAYAHSKGVIHGDLRPDNVMVGDFGETVVLEWGMARLASEAEGDASSGACDPRVDVWGVGALLYEILAGHPPLPVEQMSEALRGHTVGKVARPVRSICKEAPADLSAVAERALHPNPTRRLSRVDEVASDIAAFRAGRLLRNYRYPPWEILRKLSIRHRRLLISLLLGVTLVGGLLGWQDLELRRQATRARQQKDATLSLAETLLRRHGPALEELEAPTTLADRLLFRLEQYQSVHVGPPVASPDEALRVARNWMDLADLARSVGRPGEERHCALQALDLLESIDLPATAGASAVRGQALLRMATLCALEDQAERARTFYIRAIVQLRASGTSAAEQAKTRSSLAEARAGLGRLLASQGRTKEGMEQVQEALEVCRARGATDDRQDSLSLLEARMLLCHADILAQAGRPAEAARQRALAIDLARQRVWRSPFVAARRRELAAIELQAGQARTALRRMEALYESEPRRWRLTAEVASCALQVGETTIALSRAKDSLALAGDDPPRKLASLSLAAMAADLGGDGVGARVYVRQALEVKCKTMQRDPWPANGAAGRIAALARPTSARAARLMAGLESARKRGLAAPLLQALAEYR